MRMMPLILLPLVRGIDISDPIFDKSWISEVPFVEHLSSTELWQSFFNTSLPVKTSLPALLEVQRRWSNEYLTESFGDELVRTEPDRENRTSDYCGLVRLGTKIECTNEDIQSTKELSIYYALRDYLSNVTTLGDDFHRYVISMLPDSMADDLPFLPGFSCGLKRRFVPLDTPTDPLHATQITELNFWLSKGSTLSAIHYDMNHQIMCQIEGRKEWRFWDLRTELEHIPMWSGFYPDTRSSDDSPIDPIDVDLDKFPDFVNARWTNTTLSPGECLLIPSRHALHFVRSFPAERNIGFSVHVNADSGMQNVYDCDTDTANMASSQLGEFDVMWPFPGDPRETGYNTVRMGQGDWKELALYAIKRVHQAGISLEQVIGEITNGRSTNSASIKALLSDVTDGTDLVEVFKYGALWREVYHLRNR